MGDQIQGMVKIWRDRKRGVGGELRVRYTEERELEGRRWDKGGAREGVSGWSWEKWRWRFLF